jgi:transmembrane sensor
VLVVAPLAAVAAILFVLFGRGTRPASVPMVPALLALQDGSALPASMSAPTSRVVALDDGSRLELGASSTVRTKKVEPTRVELALDTGRTTFDVKPGGPRAWVIDAGDVTVKVLGTRFSVGRDASGVEVVVERGKVLVEGAGVPGGSRILVAGDSIVVPRGATAAAPEIAKKDPAAILVAPATPVTPVTPVTPAQPTQPIQPSGDPMARADAARRDGHPREAAGILSAMVDARDARASLAAFTLGKLHAEDLGDARTGATWFERAFALGLPTGLDEQALSRAVELHARAGNKTQAARVAGQYEARFPRGPHLENVRGWARD